MPLTNVDTEFMAVLFYFLVTACDSSFAKNARRIQRTAMRRMHGHSPVKWKALQQMQRCATETVAFFCIWLEAWWVPSGHYIAVSFVLLDHVFVLGTPNIASVHRGTTKSSAHKNSCDGPEDIKPWIQSCAGGLRACKVGTAWRLSEW